MGEELGEGVCCADCAGGGEPGRVGGGESGVGFRDAGEDFVDGEALADDAGGHDEGGVWRGGGDGVVDSGGHAGCVFHAEFSGYGVGAARVDDDGADSLAYSLFEGGAADGDGRGLELVSGEDGGGGAGR